VPHKVGAGDSPSFSPDGSRLLFVDKNRILTVAASGDGDAQPLLIDQGTVDALTLAPDGKRLAFVSHRGNHSLIGVYDFVDQTIVWLSPSLDYDSSPAFSPDGARIAFVRTFTSTARRCGRGGRECSGAVPSDPSWRATWPILPQRGCQTARLAPRWCTAGVERLLLASRQVPRWNRVPGTLGVPPDRDDVPTLAIVEELEGVDAAGERLGVIFRTT